MKHFSTFACWGIGIAAILLSPIVMILAIPVAVGIGLDIFDLYGEAPIVLALCVPVAFVLLRRLSPLALIRHLATALPRAHLPSIARSG